jgi:hypothetical protein
MFVKPAPGLLVRDPTTKFPLPPEGREVVLSSYWQRRLKDGDVVPVPPPASPEESTLEDSYHPDSDEVKP